MNIRSIAVSAGMIVSTVAHAAVVEGPGIGVTPSLTWEQLRFYSPSGGATLTYPDGQPKTIGTVLGGTDLCSDVDICSGTLSFNTLLGGTVTASGTSTSNTNAIVRQDLYPALGGLGVQGYTPATTTTSWQWNSGISKSVKTNTNNVGLPQYGSYVTTTKPAVFHGGDEINAGDKLTLTFQNTVRVLGFHFFDAAHGTSRLSGDRYGLAVDGGSPVNYSFFNGFPFNENSLLIGKTFTFSYASIRPENYYLGAIKFAQFVATPVPEPSTLAMMFAGLALMGAAGKRHASTGRSMR